jgi:hypothetical protein
MAIATYAGSVPSTIKKNKVWTIWSNGKTATTTGVTISGSYPVSRIRYNNGLYYFITYQGYVYYSTDTKTWNTSSRVAAISGWTDVSYNGTIWVAVGDTSTTKFYSSTDLNTWTSRTSNISGTGSVYQVEWIPAFSRFIAVGNGNATPWNCLSYSSDGITWTSAAVVPATVNSHVYGLAYDGVGTAFVTANNTTNNGYYSTNGTTWTATNSNGGGASGFAPTFIGGNVNRFVNGNYSQTAASIATAWATAPYTDYSLVPYYHYGMSTSFSYGTRSYFTVNTTDNVMYAFQPWPNNGGSPSLPELKTLDMANPVLYNFSTGAYNSYTLPLLHNEPLPMLAYDRANSMDPTYCTFGYGNGILVFAAYQFGQLNIYSTATA